MSNSTITTRSVLDSSSTKSGEDHIFTYQAYGLNISSDLECPELAPRAGGHMDVRVRVGHVPLEVEQSQAQGVCYQVTRERFLLNVEHIARYLVTNGNEIVVDRAPEASEREVRLFLLGSAWGALCYQRGILALHASVVQACGERSESIGDHAVAFCGATGLGKSSVAAWLIARGYRLVSDDLCRFQVVDGIARVYPSTLRLKLWRDALGAFGLSDDGLERVHFRTDKFHLTLPIPLFPDGEQGRQGDDRSAPLPLRAIYLLEWGAPGIARLSGMNALQRLVAAATYRGELLEPMGQVAAHWQRCAELARHTPIWEFARPRDWSALDAAMKTLIKDWQNTIDITEPL
jgi:hypothetical protein